MKHSSQEVDVAQLTKDLNDSLKQQKDLEEQLKCSEEERIVMRESLSKLEREKRYINRTANVYADALYEMRRTREVQNVEDSDPKFTEADGRYS